MMVKTKRPDGEQIIKAEHLRITDDFIDRLTSKSAFIKNVNSISNLKERELEMEISDLKGRIYDLESRLNKLEVE